VAFHTRIMNDRNPPWQDREGVVADGDHVSAQRVVGISTMVP